MDGKMHVTLAGIVARLDRLPVSRFHFALLVIGAASLFFDTLDGLVMTFVLSNLRTAWTIDVATIGMVSTTGFAGYLVGAAAWKVPYLHHERFHIVSGRGCRCDIRSTDLRAAARRHVARRFVVVLANSLRVNYRVVLPTVDQWICKSTH
jgi:hypothetical protein